jgi:spermidine synthase
VRPLVLALTVVTGFTGLAYEVTWQKYLAILLGAHSEATASVLGLFLGGLSFGYGVFGAVTRSLVRRGRSAGRPAPLLRVYGAVEAGIGIYALVFPWYFALVRSASLWLPTGAGPLSFALDVLLAAVLIVPPATLMGGTIPILTQALARSLSDATRLHALVYAANTAGAFVGALACGFVLIHALGLEGVLRAMGAINLAVGTGFALLGFARREVAELDPGTAAVPRGSGVAYGVVALLVGFAMMVLQTIVIRVCGLAFGSSEYAFTMVVAVFVLCIALGSAAVSAFPRIGRLALPAVLWCLGILLVGLYFVLETSPYWAHLVRVMFRDYDAAFYPYYAAVFLAILFAIGPAVALSGATLPLLFHALRREFGDLGSQAGRLYSVNTVGSLLGALIGGYALLFWLDLHHVYRIAVGAIAVAATLVTLYDVPRIRFAVAAGVLVAAVFAIARLPAWQTAYLAAGTFRYRQPTDWTLLGPSALLHRWAPDAFPFYDDDPNTSVAVQETRAGGEVVRSILVNGKSDGDTHGDLETMTMGGALPALFAARPAHAFVIGFGTGTTVGALTELDEVESVTVAEISRGVIAAAPYFDFANHDASKSPKVEFVHSDAYRALAKSRRSYDVIVSEPSNVWVTGVEMLYSREFLEAARDRLTPDGVYCQWIHLYETSSAATEIALATYAAVFDHVAVWSTNYSDRLLIGFRDANAALDVERLARRLQRPDFSAVFARLGIRDLPALLVHETLPIGVVDAAEFDGPIHSVYAPKLAFEAGRGFFVGHQASLPFTGSGDAAEIGADHSLLRRYLDGLQGDALDAAWREVAERACSHELPGCGALAASWALTPGGSEASQELLAWLEQERGPLFVRRLTALLGGSLQEGGRVRAETAQQVDELYRTEYAHSAPFDPGALLQFWNRCGLDPPGLEQCRPGLREAKRLALGERVH